MPINIVLDFIFNSANWSTIYWLSCAWYLLHLVLARRTWTVKPKNMVPVRAPFWTRTSLIWQLSSHGYFPLTNAKLLVHAALAFVPVFNTLLVYVECALAVVFEVGHYCRKLDATFVGRWLHQGARPNKS